MRKSSENLVAGLMAQQAKQEPDGQGKLPSSSAISRKVKQSFVVLADLYIWASQERYRDAISRSISSFVNRACAALMDEGVPEGTETVGDEEAARITRCVDLEPEVAEWLATESAELKIARPRGEVRTISDLINYALWRERARRSQA